MAWRGHNLAMILVALIGSRMARADDPVPPPVDTPVKVIVSGRTSTLKSITIRKVDQAIPSTYSGNRVKNTPGFTWYVSRHYALKTNMTEVQARHYLTLLELAFPHYVELFGRGLPDDQKRMAVIYATDTKTLAQALQSDGIVWNFNGGGITYEGYNAAYQYPSGSLQYHLRSILLHECTHLYQICLAGTVSSMPGWYVEGVADTLANHVWEEAEQRLTVNVVDKAPVNNYWDAGLRRIQREPYTVSDANPGNPKTKAVGGRDVGFLLITYFSTDLERWLKFRIWRDEMLRMNLRGHYHERSRLLLEDLFGGRSKLDGEFTNWVRQRRPTFHYVEWGWEQDGETLMSYGFPNSGTYSQTDLNVPLEEKPVADPLIMDYPRRHQAASFLLGTVHREASEPSVGCVLGFQKNPGKGQAGIGFGVVGRTCLRVLVDGGHKLVIDGSDLGTEQTTILLPTSVQQAITAGGQQVGLTVTIRKESVEVVVRAGRAGRVAKHKALLPISAVQRERLLSKPMAVLSRGGLHFFTPYLDVPVWPEADTQQPAPANRWRLLIDRELYTVYHAVWRLGSRAPASLIAQREKMLTAATTTPAVQLEELARFGGMLPQLRKEVQSSGAATEVIKEVLTWLGN